MTKAEQLLLREGFEVKKDNPNHYVNGNYNGNDFIMLQIDVKEKTYELFQFNEYGLPKEMSEEESRERQTDNFNVITSVALHKAIGLRMAELGMENE